MNIWPGRDFNLELWLLLTLSYFHVTQSFLTAAPSKISRTPPCDGSQLRPFIALVSALHDTVDDEFEQDKVASSTELFLEETSLHAAETTKLLSIEERTKRVLLAETVEDQIAMMEDELDELLDEDRIPLKIELSDQVVQLAVQIKKHKEKYELIVSGEDYIVSENSIDVKRDLDNNFGNFQ